MQIKMDTLKSALTIVFVAIALVSDANADPLGRLDPLQTALNLTTISGYVQTEPSISYQSVPTLRLRPVFHVAGITIDRQPPLTTGSRSQAGDTEVDNSPVFESALILTRANPPTEPILSLQPTDIFFDSVMVSAAPALISNSGCFATSSATIENTSFVADSYIQTVPEPSTIGLAGLAAGFFAILSFRIKAPSHERPTR